MEEAEATVRDTNGCQGVQDVDCEGLVGGSRVIYVLDIEQVRAEKSLSGSIDTDTEASSVIDRLEDVRSAIRMTEVVGTDHVILRHGEGFLGESRRYYFCNLWRNCETSKAGAIEFVILLLLRFFGDRD